MAAPGCLTSAKSPRQIFLDAGAGADINFFDDGTSVPVELSLGIGASF